MKNKFFIFASITLLFAFLLGVPSQILAVEAKIKTSTKLAQAQETGSVEQDKGFTLGKVTKIEDKNITIESPNKKTTTVVDASKATVEKNTPVSGEKLTISNIKVGDNLKISGTLKGKILVAKKIIIITPPKGNVIGNVLEINGNSIKIQKPGSRPEVKGAEYMVTVSDKTVVKILGKAGELKDVVVGKKIVVTGDVDESAKTIIATAINVVGNSDGIKAKEGVGSKISNGVTGFFGKVGGFFKGMFKKK